MKKSDIITHVIAATMTLVAAPILFNRFSEMIDIIPEGSKRISFEDDDEDYD